MLWNEIEVPDEMNWTMDAWLSAKLIDDWAIFLGSSRERHSPEVILSSTAFRARSHFAHRRASRGFDALSASESAVATSSNRDGIS